MKNNFRILLLILFVLFVGTALTIRSSIGNNEILELDTDYLNKNLNKKEKLVKHIFSDSLLLKTFINSEHYPLQLKEVSNNYTKEYIYLYIYKDNNPIFWSSNIYLPLSPAGLPKRTSFIQTDHYSFVVHKKNLDNGITVLALIPIEQNYLTKGNRKKNNLYSYLDADNLVIANFNDSENIRNIHALDGSFLFSVTLKPGKYNNIYIQLQLLCWVIATLSLITVITSLSLELARHQKPLQSIILLGITLFIIRIIDLESNWISSHSNLDIFLPSKYSYNYFSPNLWAFLTNSLSILWLILYTVYIKQYIFNAIRVNKKIVSVISYYLLICLLYIFYIYTFDQLATLITHTDIYHTNLAQFLYSNDLTLVHILIYSICITSLIVLTDFILELVQHFKLKNNTTLNIQLIALAQFILINALVSSFSLVSILIGILIIIRPFDKVVFQDKNKSINIITLITLALITNIKFAEASKEAQIEQMKITVSEIQSEDDVLAISKFRQIENEIISDPQLKILLQIVKGPDKENIIDEYIRKKYLTGYISQYDFDGYYFKNDLPLGKYDSEILDIFREKVIGRSIKVDQTQQFYKSQVTGLGVYEYFCVIRYQLPNNETATVILDFTNKNNNQVLNLIKGERSFIANSPNTEDNSFAIYKNGLLISQKGKYIYPNRDNNMPSSINDFVSFESNDGYYHIVFRTNDNETIVVSKQNQSYWQFIAIASIVFLLLYGLSFIIHFILHFVPQLIDEKFKFRNLRYQIRGIFNNIRYSTRIQTIIISSVVIVIFISGFITYHSVRTQTEETRENNRLRRVALVASKFELKTLTENYQNQMTYLIDMMESFSDISTTDYNLYDHAGRLFYTTQPKVYEQNLIAKVMNPNALIDLNVLKKSETLTEENIIDFKYESVYAGIKNNNYQTIAYLSMPYYNSQEIKQESQNILLNTIFNIYTLIIIIFAFISIYIANRITAPLQLIRKKLSSTHLDEKLNEPLYWEKDDEIGQLIKDYNHMLVKLGENAKQLRNAERESAWREMAKQVAHEIKNPLTPMKLGIQQLSRSFHENDPRLAERFDKTTNSFIEQIDALAHIANEFSVFAKLPDTNLVVINLEKEILQSIELFKHSKNTQIKFKNNVASASLNVLADRDQIIRSFNNLIKNAIEATSSKRKHIIQITINHYIGNWIKIAIQDNGDGIPKDQLKNIFKPNFTTKSSGTGLGLAFVKQTVDSIGGNIYFETELNIGTTFYLELPLHQDKE